MEKRLHSLSLLRMNKMANLRADPDNYPIYPMEKRLHNLSLLRMNKFSPKQDSVRNTIEINHPGWRLIELVCYRGTCYHEPIAKKI